MKTAWDESTVTWNAPQEGKIVAGRRELRFWPQMRPGRSLVSLCCPKQGADTVDPPIEYQFDVTDLVKSWLDGGAPNLGVAIAPVDRPERGRGDPFALPDLLVRAQPRQSNAEADIAGAGVTAGGALDRLTAADVEALSTGRLARRSAHK